MRSSLLVPISVDALKPGMIMDYDVYYKTKREYVLLIKDRILSEDTIMRLRRVNDWAYNVYVPSDQREKILSKNSFIEDAQKNLENRIGYIETKIQITSMFNEIVGSGNVTPEESHGIASDLITKIDTVDASLIIQCVSNIRNTDEYLYTHSINVALLNGIMAKWCIFDEEMSVDLVKTGLMHDIGKLSIPSEILNKPASLTAEEFEIMRLHSTNSYKMLKRIGEENTQILEGVLYHHEQMNGNGYPSKLAGDKIPVFARITSICDVYDAMVAKRVYKKSQSPFAILRELSRNKFSALDADYVSVFLTNIPKVLEKKLVLLSNGAIARVHHVNQADLEYPIVDIDGELLQTTQEVHCICMYVEYENLFENTTY